MDWYHDWLRNFLQVLKNLVIDHGKQSYAIENQLIVIRKLENCQLILWNICLQALKNDCFQEFLNNWFDSVGRLLVERPAFHIYFDQTFVLYLVIWRAIRKIFYWLWLVMLLFTLYLLSIHSYHGKSFSESVTGTQHLIKIIQIGYALPVLNGSLVLKNITNFL